MSLSRWWVLGRKNYNAPLVTVIKLSGVLQSPLTRGGPGAGSRRLYAERAQKWIDRAFSKSLRPAAVAIVVNSPGGSPTQAELIHKAILEKAKNNGNIPVYTFAEDVAASGGYWLLCAGKEIYACETSIVGSIGVISSSFGAVEAINKLGIERRVYTAGASKSSLDPFLKVQPEQETRLKHVMTDLHATFQNAVKAARQNKLKGISSNKEQVTDDIFDGRVFSGRQALEVGLVDGIGSVDTVMKEKLGDKTRFLVCSETPQPGLFSGLLGGQAMVSNPVERAISSVYNKIAGGGSGIDSSSEYEMYRQMMGAFMDEAEQRALWDTHTVR